MSQPAVDDCLTWAVHNNAVWCDTICRAHGTPGRFLEEIWINSQPSPPFYPNAVTLSGAEGIGMQLIAIRDLLETDLAGEWAVKDSFCTLDLAPLGFGPLFEAEWIWRSTAQPRPDGGIAGVGWTTIRHAPELAAWEAAWGGTPIGEAPTTTRIFLPPLLEDEDIAVIAAYQDRRIVAGVIANRTGNVVGVSNLFVPEQDSERFRAGCIAAVIDAFPGLPLVGYESGHDLQAAQALGFDILGPLRIWARTQPSA